QGAVERQYLPGHALANLALRVAIGDAEVSPEQADDRQIAGALAVGHCPALEHEPRRDAERVCHLEHQARFADTWLTHHGDNLALSAGNGAGHLVEALEVPGAVDERAQRTSSAREARLLAALDAGGRHRAVAEGLHRKAMLEEPRRGRVDDDLV